MSHLVMAVFHDRDEALSAVDALVDQGVDPLAIGFLALHPGAQMPGVAGRAEPPTTNRPEVAPLGAPPANPGVPAAAATPGSALTHLASLELLGLGQLLAAGPLVEALRCSPSWPEERAVCDCLVRRGIDTQAALLAIEELRAGGIVLTVHDPHRARAETILARHHPTELV